ncbi:phenylalanine--tRNA ligase subunit alpha [Candidatus Woesebacteria bacterium RIFCSPHIGHO2_01_FULL_38_9]|uniref:Phenylalanine--tRNA ligase alpha subunit n=1 Tax=Candidatus Woesebacteria bacterium RIFCSPHIGHO2_01_FULL_38_9 TaxID=1802492 RepID=A0A1F7Y4I2_9BACT|nr:MAG: phenylalanine--tRNA ligase subunit alpha [Candidatus Woesebacteria bacterium RIFCSPHIGHO2_01_FULL_38_9]
MREEIQNTKNEALAQIMESYDAKELENLRVQYLGRNGKLIKITKELKNVKVEERKEIGRLVNDAKNTLIKAFADQRNRSREAVREWFDATIPGKKPTLGHLHLITQAIEEIAQVFEKIAFTRVRYPEVEWNWFAFESLNIPKDHPAQDTLETFYIDAPSHPKYGNMVLSPHTSSGQVREMWRVGKPPIRMTNIAKCYRRQSDVSHTQMFHQFEGLVIDSGISIIHLKGTIDYFAKSYFGINRKTRLRPYHFQFTEPSFEVDITCDICEGRGCKVCKEGWLELGGAGMVHPTVLTNGKIDPKKYSGFAFGIGVERVLMMKKGIKIPDLRLLYSSDLRFLRQF